MTDLTIVRGDSRNYQLFVTEADTVTPVDLTGAILRFAIKRFPTEPNSCGIVILTSYDATEIIITDAVNGEAVIFVQSRHTARQKAMDYFWDIEVARKNLSITTAGTISVTSGSDIITGTGLVLTDVGIGDIITPAGATGPNQIDLVITAIGGDGTELDPGAGNLRTDYSSWDTEAAFAHEIFRGDIKTPTDLSGTFTIATDVVS